MNQSKFRLSRLWPTPGLLLLLPVLLPLLRPGFYLSYDGHFHVYRIAALADAWREGVLHPRLFPDFGFGYGQAVLNFYSPLSYWPGALLSLLGMSPAVAFQWTVGLGFVLAALTAYGYVRALWGETAGVLAALVYSYLPYRLVDAYTRGALPEHFAFIFPPLILWAYSGAFRQEKSRMPLLWGALAWAGLVLTHNLTTMLMALAVMPYLLLLAWQTGRWNRLPAVVGSLLLAMGISAGYWLPVLAESGAVGIGGGGPSQGFVNHLLAFPDLLVGGLRYPYRDIEALGLIYPLSWLTPLLLISGGAALWARRIRSVERLPAAYHLVLALAAIGMTTTLSLPVWLPLTPLLGHLQYPWRFLVLEALGLMGCAALLPRLLPRLPIWLLTGGLALLLILFSLPGLPDRPLEISAAQAWSPQRMWDEDAAEGQVGATWTGEFVPTTVTEQRWALGRPREGATDGTPLAPPTIRMDEVGHSQMAVTVDAAAAFDLRLHQFYLPGWNGELDGAALPLFASGEMGLVTGQIPPGRHQIALFFGPTLARRIGAVTGLIGVFLWAVFAWVGGQRRVGLLLLLIAGGLAVNSLGVGAMTRTPLPVNAQVGDVARLIGYESRPARGERALDVTLYWFALRDTGSNLNVFLHLLGPDGGVISQHDGAPVGGFTPTSRWRAGEIIADTHRIPLPPEIGPGEYALKAGMYDPVTVTNLPVDPPTPDNRVDLGRVTVTP